MTKIGTGFVEVDADLSSFWRKVERELGGGIGDAKFNALGGSAGRSLSKGLLSGVNTGSLGRIGDRAGRDFAAGVSKGVAPTKAALGDVSATAARTGRDIEAAAARGSTGLRDLDANARRTSKGLRDVDGAAGGAGGGLRNVRRAVDDFGGSFNGGVAAVGGLRISLALVVPALIGFGGAATAAASALIPLIGLAAAGGNAIVGLAQGFSVLKLATAGIGAALKEQTTNQLRVGGAAATAAGQQRSAARAIQSAQDAVHNAVQRVADAARGQTDALRSQKSAFAALAPAITEARRALTDYRAGAVDTGLALTGAKQAATDARTELVKLLAGTSPRELAAAHQAVTDSLRGEEAAARSLTDAQKALNDLLAPPSILDDADAHDAVTDSVRGEARARLNLAQLIEKQNKAAAADGISAAAWAEAAKNGISITVPTGSAFDPAQAALDLADAQNAVTDAVRGTARAQDNLTKLETGASQDDIVAARQRVTDAEEGVAAAARATINARADLTTAETPASAHAIAEARLAVADADNAVTHAITDQVRATRDLADAQHAGIEGATGVVAAHDAIRSAEQGVADAAREIVDADLAVVRANQAFSDAQLSAKEQMAASAVTAANLNQKLNALPPAAQAFVRQLVAMKPKLDELRQTAAAGFFPGATEGLKAAIGSFSSVNKVVGETATVLGEAARKSGELVGSPAFGKDIETIGGNNAKVLETLGEALRHIISALRNVAVVAGPLTQWLADLANKWALNAAEAAKAGRESGRMAEFFEKTRKIAEVLGSTLGHLAHGLLGVGDAGSKTGNDIWKSINRAATRFDEWANSASGQKELKQFFKDAQEAAAAFTEALKGISKAAVVIGLGPITTALKLLGPYADTATYAIIGYKVAVAAAGVASKVMAAGTWALTLAMKNAFIAEKLAGAFWALNAAMDANPIGLIVIGIAALAAGLIYAYMHSETFRNIVAGALHAVGAAFTWMWNAAKDVFDWLEKAWGAVTAFISDPIGAAIDAIKGFGGLFLDAAKWLLDQFITGIKSAFGAVKSVGSWILDKIIDGFKTVTDLLGTVGGWLKNRFVEGIHTAVDGFTSLGSWILNKVVDGFKAVTDLLGTVGGWLKNRFVEFIHNEVDGLTVIGSWILNKVVDGFTTITDALAGAGGWVKNRFVDLVHAIGDDLKKLGGWMLDKIVDGLKGGGNLLVGFVNDIIHVLNSLLTKIGVDKIDDIKGFATGGIHKASEQRMARGGAFARTGGIVNQPITLMGEEAPTWPEFVIPSNPAYRKRAQMLLAQAAGQIGLAKGGVFGALEGAIGSVTGLLGKGALALLGSFPGVGDLPDWLKGTGKYVLEAVGNWIKDQVGSLIGAGGKTASGPDGIGTFEGVPMADWVIGALKYARTHGASGHPTSGYRPGFDPHTRSGKSEHQGTRYPHGAVDFGDFNSGLAVKMSYVNATRGYKYPLLAPIGFHDDGHASGTGHKTGGVFSDLPFAGSFGNGGIVPGPAGKAYSAVVHGTEVIQRPGDGATVEDLVRALAGMPLTVMIGGKVIEETVELVVGRQGRRADLQLQAGGI